MNQVAAFFTTLSLAISDRFAGRKDRGATAVEYGLLVGLIAVVIIGAVLLLGGTLEDLFTGVNDKLGPVATPATNASA